jgi:hypothetical protein
MAAGLGRKAASLTIAPAPGRPRIVRVLNVRRAELRELRLPISGTRKPSTISV